MPSMAVVAAFRLTMPPLRWKVPRPANVNEPSRLMVLFVAVRVLLLFQVPCSVSRSRMEFSRRSSLPRSKTT